MDKLKNLLLSYDINVEVDSKEQIEEKISNLLTKDSNTIIVGCLLTYMELNKFSPEELLENYCKWWKENMRC